MAATYAILHERLAKDTINFITDTFKVLLVGTGYTYNETSHQFVSDVSSNEISATNYVRKSLTLTITRQDSATPKRTVVILSQPTWTSLGGATNDTIAGAIWFKDTGSDSTSPLCQFTDLTPSNLTTNGSNFQLTYDQTKIGRAHV